QYDGPWQKDEDLEHLSLWSKYQRATSFGEMAVTLSGYEAQWDPTEQVPERAFGTAACADEFCSLDPSAHGDTSRWIINSELTGRDWSASGFAQYYDWHMSSNPTYDFQINQFDRRWTAGGAVEKTLWQIDSLQ